MPKVNLSEGTYGIFIPSYDKAAFWYPQPFSTYWTVDDSLTAGLVTNLAPIPNAFWQVNLSKFMHQISMSPNVTLGGAYGANMLAAIDVVYSVGGQPLTEVSHGMEQDYYINGRPPQVMYTGEGGMQPPPQFFLQGVLPAAVNAPNFYVARLTLPDYWPIDQNLPDACTSFYFNFGVPGTIMVAGVQMYFGNV